MVFTARRDTGAPPRLEGPVGSAGPVVDSFPRQENRLAGVLYEVQGILKLLVLSVGYEGHMHSWLSTLNFRLFRIVLVHWLCRCRQRS